MKLGEVFRNAIKGAATLFVVGVALSYLAPLAAAVLGETLLGAAGMKIAAGVAEVAMYNGMFFGLFGALNAVAGPAMEWAFGGAKDEPAARKENNVERLVIIQPARTRGHTFHVHNNDVDVNLQANISNHDTRRSDYAAKLQEERARTPIHIAGNQITH